tara:strand:+ start:98 stop:364 length:267 start_codon:yes stop_codon:yes gene_type:complete
MNTQQIEEVTFLLELSKAFATKWIKVSEALDGAEELFDKEVGLIDKRISKVAGKDEHDDVVGMALLEYQEGRMDFNDMMSILSTENEL